MTSRRQEPSQNRLRWPHRVSKAHFKPSVQPRFSVNRARTPHLSRRSTRELKLMLWVQERVGSKFVPNTGGLQVSYAKRRQQESGGTHNEINPDGSRAVREEQDGSSCMPLLDVALPSGVSL